MRLTKAAALGCAVIAFAGPGMARASDNGKQFVIFGAGLDTCGKWVAARSGPGHGDAQLTWIAGYLTGFNEWGWRGRDISGGEDGPAIAGWMDNYCRAHPLDNLREATDALIVELSSRQKR